MTTAIIVQARMGSSRLPAKVTLPLGTITPLAAVLRRCRRVPGVDVVVCAIPEAPENDPVADLASTAGATIFRGSELDVLDRYHQAARSVAADIVMRITSDCPLVDPALCGRVLALLHATGADYACNNLPPLWPHGLDCDAFPAALLAEAAATARDPYEREHVTPWLRRHPGLLRANLDGPGGGLEQLRWTLDYPEDYAFFQAVWQALGEAADTAGLADLLALLDRRPELSDINRNRIDRQRLVDDAATAQLRVPGRLASVPVSGPLTSLVHPGAR